MSASLVGSEMCIRDRPDHHRGRRQRGRELVEAVSKPAFETRASGRGWEPVSYTHLTLPTICSV
eukprot:9585442-Alexandrium_andersonii.AAC.1